MDYPKSMPSAGLVNGKFVDENPIAGTPGSLIPASWGNGVTEEVLNVINAAGLTASEGNNKQLLEAVNKLITTSLQRSGSPSGLLLNASFSIPVAALSGTFTADELTVQPSVDSATYRLQDFGKSINLGVVGAGGMDVGPAPVNGFVALYAIYNSVTDESSMLAINSTSAIAPRVYGGGRMPAGYNASALISVWPTDAAGKLKVGAQRGRKVYISLTSAYTGSAILTAAPLSLAGIVPRNAYEINGEMVISNGSATPAYIYMVLNANGVGLGQQIIGGSLGSGANMANNYAMPVIATQTIYMHCQSAASAPVFEVYISSYSFN